MKEERNKSRLLSIEECVRYFIIESHRAELERYGEVELTAHGYLLNRNQFEYLRAVAVGSGKTADPPK